MLLLFALLQWRVLAAVQMYFEPPKPLLPGLPLGYEDELAHAADELARQGFVPLGRFEQPLLPDSADLARNDVAAHWFANASGDTLVQLRWPDDAAHAAWLYNSVFTASADGRWLSSGMVSPVARILATPQCPVNVVAPGPIQLLLHAHRQWLHRLSATAVPISADAPLTAERAMACVNTQIQQQMQQLQAMGRIKPDPRPTTPC